MRRGDVVTVVTSGACGKPRPALIVQADVFEAIPSVTVSPLTSDIHDEDMVRITLHSTVENGLRSMSQVMIDKTVTVPRTKVGDVIGRADDAVMRVVGEAMSRFLGL